VIALHCSGSSGRQWRALQEAAPDFDIMAPDLTGVTPGGWRGESAFCLACEGEAMAAVIGAHPGRVHLVGHSYGGALALHLAAHAPDKVASLCLYEPSAFHVLKAGGPGEALAYREIASVASATVRGLVAGDYEAAAARFVSYWGGPDAWSRLKPAVRDATRAAVPSIVLHFRALMIEPTSLGDFSRLRIPVMIMRGGRSPEPARCVADLLARVIPGAVTTRFADWDHMAPIAHAQEIADRMASFLRETTARQRPTDKQKAA
jgi:pimeloyl-ACP methyl ester carboxylesterase